jgi:hypothetical protein
MRFQFRIWDLGLVAVIIALTLGWLLDHKRLTDEIEHVRALVEPACAIAGRVTYHGTGKPAAGVRIHAQATDITSPSDSELRRRWGTARTDADGRYKFVGLSPTNWNIFVEVDGWTAIAIDALPVLPGQEIKNADLQLVKGGFIEGRVVDQAGNPVVRVQGQRVTVGVYGPARPTSGAAIEAVYLDAKGRFRIRVPPGKNYPYLSSIMPQSVLEGLEFEHEGVTVVEGEATEIEFRIMSTGVRTGRRWPPAQPKESASSDE